MANEQKFSKNEIARLITATLIQKEIEFDRQEKGGTIEFVVYRDGKEAGPFFAIMDSFYSK